MKDHMDMAGLAVMVLLTLLWGVNFSAVKIANTGFAPVFNSFLRSSIASALGIFYCLAIRQPLLHRDIRLVHGVVAGILFGLEFVCIYWGMLYTDAARAVILVNCSPFFVAIGAFFFLCERLHAPKVAGFVLAFAGVLLVFWGKPKTSGSSMLLGDLLEVLGALLWGATTIYIKKYLSERVHPINTFLYQLVFSVPILLACAWALEPRWILTINAPAVSALIFSSVIVAFASYLAWYKLIHTYPVSELAVLSFLSPVFGVASGTLFLGEQFTPGLVLGLAFVSVGIFVTNYRRR